MDDVVNALHARGPVLFVAVATAQIAANLPPIIEMAEPGDSVLWLESARAQAEGWADGARAVLGQRQIQSVAPVGIPDEPADVVKRVNDALGALAGWHPAFVYNGGTKGVFEKGHVDRLARVAVAAMRMKVSVAPVSCS